MDRDISGQRKRRKKEEKKCKIFLNLAIITTEEQSFQGAFKQ